MSKRILVTGAAGFIGSHTVERLVSRGDRVVGLDNFNDYYDPEKKRANLREVVANLGSSAAQFRFEEGDIRDLSWLEQLFAAEQFDAVVHLAAMAGVRASMDAPHLYYQVNLTGTLNLLELCKERVPHFVFASTSSAYGKTDQIPFVETDCADKPLAPYPASKRSGELLGYSYHHLYQLSFTALRFFTVYGPRNRPDMMAYKILSNIFSGEAVPLYNGGNMYRDWTFVEDIVSGVVAAADRPLGYQVINLGRGEPVLLLDFVNKLETLSGRKSALSSEPMPKADVPETFASIDKARELLGYAPKVSVDEGVERLWHWYQARVLGDTAGS